MVCHPQNGASLEPVYIITKTGRREVGQIKLCGGIVSGKGGWDSCYKILSPLQRFKGGAVITDTAWSQMITCHPKPPYYFRKDGERWVPETWQGPVKVKEQVIQPEPVEFGEPEPDYL